MIGGARRSLGAEFSLSRPTPIATPRSAFRRSRPEHRANSDAQASQIVGSDTIAGHQEADDGLRQQLFETGLANHPIVLPGRSTTNSRHLESTSSPPSGFQRCPSAQGPLPKPSLTNTRPSKYPTGLRALSEHCCLCSQAGLTAFRLNPPTPLAGRPTAGSWR